MFNCFRFKVVVSQKLTRLFYVKETQFTKTHKEHFGYYNQPINNMFTRILIIVTVLRQETDTRKFQAQDKTSVPLGVLCLNLRLELIESLGKNSNSWFWIISLSSVIRTCGAHLNQAFIEHIFKQSLDHLPINHFRIKMVCGEPIASKGGQLMHLLISFDGKYEQIDVYVLMKFDSRYLSKDQHFLCWNVSPRNYLRWQASFYTQRSTTTNLPRTLHAEIFVILFSTRRTHTSASPCVWAYSNISDDRVSQTEMLAWHLVDFSNAADLVWRRKFKKKILKIWKELLAGPRSPG